MSLPPKAVAVGVPAKILSHAGSGRLIVLPGDTERAAAEQPNAFASSQGAARLEAVQPAARPGEAETSATSGQDRRIAS